jgi:hypothetical protein
LIDVFTLLMIRIGWQVSQAKDPITDQNNVTAVIRGDNASIEFRCAVGEKPSLAYVPDEFLGGGGTSYALRDFIYRFDGAKPELESWKHLNRYAVPYSEKRAAAFVTKMIGAKQLVIRAERYDGRRIDSIFDLTGAPQAFHQAFQACGIR